ncbi:hypothetical protein CP960_10215 [Malaciobacter halophilus]|uniref:Uncharacterized protein n=1 Tax=Malaciobacter halophilus TaxID=197482 RepID=A0A2N1J1D4_9BACT|nr:hypothetical protein [Malaciobacter halophilus]AXH08534.1 hypothetical protein AHALO_0114 [Malaciobacter halophilus]PKI80314.1 hypothetical protein CP960_10215 [Malaciobacter halophilus]
MRFIQTLFLILIITIFTACATKNQSSIQSSNNKQISELLDEIHQKDLKITKLEKELEEYKKRYN